MPTYNVIGDVHGRTSWKNLVDEECINIFVGDFFDPYERIHFMDLQYNYLEIIEYKKSHPDNVVLLYGNHDYEYLPGIREESNRYDSRNAEMITWLLMENADLFEGVAYAIGEDHLVTHAGVTTQWKEKYLPEVDDISPSAMAAAINELWRNNKDAFSFWENAGPSDYYGTSPQHSPIWVRPTSLCLHNLYKGTPIKQVVGHTQKKDISEIENVVFVDCLGTVAKSWKLIPKGNNKTTEM